ncbi:DMT family transporter [Rhodobacteraceae bacterium NNCM2]|nr:DMT family transporter [Coraliihabitans acroporae]
MLARFELRMAAAPLFVLLWSTGFIGAKLGLPDAEPLTFLAHRFGIAAGLLGLWVLVRGARWPTLREARDAAIVGLLVQGVYLGGTFVAISWGTEAGVSAMIAGLQPIVTALIARKVLGERLNRVQQVGMVLGAAGVGLVVLRKVSGGVGDWYGVAACLAGLVAIAVGAIMQKTRAGNTPMLTGNLIQFAAAGAACALLAMLFETGEINWTGEFIFALGWLVIVLSLGAVTLYFFMIRRGGASNVASLFFLVPPSTAIIAYFMFGEVLGPVEIAGMIVASIGVLMVNRSEWIIRLSGRYLPRS